MFTILTIRAPKGSISSSVHMTCEAGMFQTKLIALGYTILDTKTVSTITEAHIWSDYLQNQANKLSLDEQARYLLNN